MYPIKHYRLPNHMDWVVVFYQLSKESCLILFWNGAYVVYTGFHMVKSCLILFWNGAYVVCTGFDMVNKSGVSEFFSQLSEINRQ